MWLLRIATAGAIAVAAQLAYAQCGGTERWALKVGADPGAAGLAILSPVSTSLHDLVRLERPALPADEDTHTMAERQVRVVDGPFHEAVDAPIVTSDFSLHP